MKPACFDVFARSSDTVGGSLRAWSGARPVSGAIDGSRSTLIFSKRFFCRCVALIFAMLWMSSSVRAGLEPEFRCAVVIDPSFEKGLPVAHILESDLTSRFTMIDRSAIDQLLREREVQALFTPESGSGRSIFGKLLKADLLVLLRPSKAAGRAMEVIVCETARGLRLCVQTLPLSSDPEVDAGAIAGWVADAVPKLREPIRRIVAVPPFVSDDLGYDFDYLKSAYATVVEQLMARRKGVVAVELAEARAIADEIIVTSGDDVARRRPLLFLGEFRHQGIGRSKTVTLKLELMDKDRAVGQLTQEGIAPARAPELLQSTAARWLDEAMQQPFDQSSDPGAEAGRLFERASAFERIGDWDEALQLLEAGLLLKSSPDAHRRAAMMLFRLAADAGRTGTDPKSRAMLLRYARQQYGHIEPWARTVTDVKLQNWHGGRLCIYPAPNPDDSPSFRQAICDTQRLEIEMALRLVGDRVRAGRPWGDLLPIICLRFRADDEPPDFFDRELGYMRERTLAPDAFLIAYNCAASHIAMGTPNVDQFLKALAALPNPQVAGGVQQAWADSRRPPIRPQVALQASGPPFRPRTAASRPDAAAGPPEVQFEPLSIKLIDTDGQILNDHYFLPDCIPAGPGLDVSCVGNRFEVMRAKGSIRRIYEAPLHRASFGTPCYDGRYVWSPMSIGSGLVVFDPIMDRVHEFGAEDGIPADSRYLQATPLAPGSVCVAGVVEHSSLPARTWCAILSLDAGAKRTEIFFEARDIPDPSQSAQTQDIGAAFRPTALYPVDGEQVGQTRGKRYLFLGGRGRPLLIDPQTLEVRICRLNVASISPSGVSIGDGDRIDLTWVPTDLPASLQISHLVPLFIPRIDEATSLSTGPLTALMQLDETTGRIDWGIYHHKAQQVRRLRGALPVQHGKLCLSNHYGLVFLGASQSWQIHLLGIDLPPAIGVNAD